MLSFIAQAHIIIIAVTVFFFLFSHFFRSLLVRYTMGRSSMFLLICNQPSTMANNPNKVKLYGKCFIIPSSTTAIPQIVGNALYCGAM